MLIRNHDLTYCLPLIRIRCYFQRYALYKFTFCSLTYFYENKIHCNITSCSGDCRLLCGVDERRQ